MTHHRRRTEKSEDISCLEELDVLFLEAEGFFMEVPRINIKFDLFYD
jgi:hypothetical protein